MCGGGGGAVVKLRDDLNSAAEVSEYVAHFTCLYHCSIMLYLRSFKTTVYTSNETWLIFTFNYLLLRSKVEGIFQLIGSLSFAFPGTANGRFELSSQNFR